LKIEGRKGRKSEERKNEERKNEERKNEERKNEERREVSPMMRGRRKRNCLCC
jgi:hypothetical protein